LDTSFFISLKIMDQEIEILVERRLRMGIKCNRLIGLVEKLFAKFNIGKIKEHLPKGTVCGKSNARVYPFGIGLYIFFGQGLPKFRSFLVALFQNIEGKLDVF